MKIDIIKKSITAKSRKLTATWTYEVAQDLESEHGISIEKEIHIALMWDEKAKSFITQFELCEYGNDNVFIGLRRITDL